MTITASKVSGSGGIVSGSEISYSYTEDVTSLEPSNLDGGSGQVTLSAIAPDASAGFRNDPRLIINNKMLLSDTSVGEIEFSVKRVGLNQRLVSITGDTVQARMNVDKTAAPIGGTSGSEVYLRDAIEYYCGLVGIIPTFDEGFSALAEARKVNFIGWTGNVWEHLKMLCSVVSADDSEWVPFEMFVDVDTLHFRLAENRTANLTDNASSLSVEVDAFDAAQSISLTYYKTEYKEDGIVTEDVETELTGFVRQASINDQMQVDAGQTVKKRFAIKASLNTVNQPVPVSTISTFPYTGTTGEYVIVGSDDLPVLPEQWIAEGGQVNVELTENPNEIEITVVAPQASQLQQAGDPEAFSLAPYKIGVESSGGQDYPAFFITGTGVFFERKSYDFYTGAGSDKTADGAAPSIDNQFVITKRELVRAGTAAAQVTCGPNISMNLSNPVDAVFGETIGTVITYKGQDFRIKSCSFSEGNSSMAARSSSRVARFDEIWEGKTFADFTEVMSDPDTSPDDYVSFNEFSALPLNEDI
jgi:hypothetical protein